MRRYQSLGELRTALVQPSLIERCGCAPLDLPEGELRTALFAGRVDDAIALLADTREPRMQLLREHLQRRAALGDTDPLLALFDATDPA